MFGKLANYYFKKSLTSKNKDIEILTFTLRMLNKVYENNIVDPNNICLPHH